MLKEKLSLLPEVPGCYLMKNKDNVIIYVGKAKNLKRRVNSYFNREHTGKTAKLVSEIVDFEYITVNSETESLILEINLIKKYDPKYNILLRDDKSYPYIELTNDKVPRLLIVRNLNLKKKKDRLYGPYPNVTAARTTVNMLNRIYPLRKCKNMGKKVCLYYHIGECLGYCEKKVDPLELNEMVSEITKFLNGDDTYIVKKIKEEMTIESEKMNYEKAKELKDLLDYINITLTKQKVEINDNISKDVFGYYVSKGYLSIQVFFIRNGKIVGRHSKIIPMIDTENDELTRYIATFYDKGVIIPKEILVPNIVDTELLSDYFKVNISTPIRGVKHRIVLMANENAKTSLEENFELIKKDERRTINANESLRKLLGISKLDRIELFDNSNLFGNYNVSGMVVYVNGKESKNDYRKYKIHVDKNDDYGTMREVLYRRYFRVLSDNLVRPDLIIVDGALGQLNIALEVLDKLGLDIKVVGLKKDDKHNTKALITKDKEYEIDKNSDLFHYLERMQDEVHNFTINYHRQLRNKGSLSSLLDNIDGIGKKRKIELLKKFKNITEMKNKSIEELEEVVPHKVALELYEFLKER
ncbi:MAG: excinuclease ABC subunit UvrC [Bacillales bacterium]|nr:excinuclease ABC subunit UvrC [Bacillales bacterium]